MPHRSKPQATVLARWRFGMVLAQRCGLTSVAWTLAPLLGCRANTLRQRLRAWCDDTPHKAGSKRGIPRDALDVTTCFLPLMRWVLAWWPPDEQRLALAIDASPLGQRFTVLAVSLIERCCAIPIAWVVVPARRTGAWRPHWERLLSQIQPGIPATWTVIVLADRGLSATWVYQHIVALGWHPCLRINRGGNYRRQGHTRFRSLSRVVRQGGPVWAGPVTWFSPRGAHLAGTLLARWDARHTDPWLIVTDLPLAAADVVWYSLRPLIACSFKAVKRGGWHWEQTNMTDPDRATRRWLAIAVATLWVVSVGGMAEVTRPASMLDTLPETQSARRRPTRRSQPHQLRCFRRGVITIITSLLNDGRLPRSGFVPEPWPESLDTHATDPSVYTPHQKAA
jgi:hypothetical protein